VARADSSCLLMASRSAKSAREDRVAPRPTKVKEKIRSRYIDGVQRSSANSTLSSEFARARKAPGRARGGNRRKDLGANGSQISDSPPKPHGDGKRDGKEREEKRRGGRSGGAAARFLAHKGYGAISRYAGSSGRRGT